MDVDAYFDIVFGWNLLCSHEPIADDTTGEQARVLLTCAALQP